ncbi:TonB-dependent siderophore receptor [Gemmatirosa kalamazoonensis]|uniref:TonB-dependent siderophore receptor n=1 Tax=Gemmatirosa kalamazoonensis TaxID=861299 RepID=W0RPY4_9BACT|nr:TonB-dependent siderophore receptor [Gemmatirosa kalamazoonensis]AHG91573.1 TonB-dependent siderophore receptor [Gemmatirosa kalamazoonensis]
MPTTRPRHALLLLGSLALGAPLAAQTTPDSAPRRRPDSTAQALAAMRVTAGRARTGAYAPARTATATKTDTPLRDTPQAVSVVTRQLIADQAMQGMADVVRYVPGVSMSGGEGHRDQPTIRGNSSTADFFVDGVRDDAQYYRDLYNVERVEALKGSNAMIFGRGGGGGVINRVMKQAEWAPTRTITVEGGSFDHKRGALDVGAALGRAAVRLDGVYEKSGVFRDVPGFRRYGVNPTAALALSPSTTLRASYEYFDDDRTVDRGIPSFQGRPSPADVRTFFGNPAVNRAFAHVHQGSTTIEHVAARGLRVTNRTRLADYDKFYQNTYPGAVNAAGTQVSLSAYNHALRRRNLFNQTDVVLPLGTGAARHTLLVGAEVGRQRTDQVRQTGYFDGIATSLSVPFAQPTVETPVTFRPSATDADNLARATVAAAYLQDQLALGEHVQAVVGVRYDRFAIAYHNDRTGQRLSRTDRLVSPRAGLVLKPATPLSLYGSYGVSFLPSSGDQFTALTVTSQTLEPERFTNREIGAKWDARADLALTAAAYRLDRTNTSAPDPSDPAKVVQTGAQRTTGMELGVTGNVTRAWQIAGGLAAQRARIVSTTSAAKAGQTVPLVPRRTLSLWNRYQILPALGAGVGIVRQSDVYAAIDDAVTLPGFTRVDGAVYVGLARNVRAQLNVENVLDARYYGVSNGNNNIMPGATRTVRVSLTTGF